MTQEQFKEAVKINERLEQLIQVRKELNTGNRPNLAYIGQKGFISGYESIKNLLLKHDEMIRAEIEQELASLLKKIDEL